MDLKALFALICAIFLVALNGVFLGSKTQQIHPLYILFWSYLGTTLFFLIGRLPEIRAFASKCRAHLGLVLLVNALTSGCCFGFFFAVKFIEPALSSVIASSVGPALAVFHQYLTSNESLSSQSKLSSAGIWFSLLLVVYGILDGQSAVLQAGRHTSLIGICMALLLGVSQILYVIYSRELGQRGEFSTSQLMSVRFVSTIVLSFFLSDGDLFTFDPEPLLVVAQVCVFGAILPLYMTQYSISRLDPFVVATVLVMQALFMAGLQIFDPRLKSSPISFAGVVLATCFSVVGIYSRRRHVTAHATSQPSQSEGGV